MALWLAGFLKLKAEVERDCSLGMADVITPGPPLLIQLQTCILPKDRSLADTHCKKSVSKNFAQTRGGCMGRNFGQ